MVWHVNWLDEPERTWNRFENYFPGENYCDWLRSAPTDQRLRRCTMVPRASRLKYGEAYARLTRIAPGSHDIAEFGCDLHNRHVNAATGQRRR